MAPLSSEYTRWDRRLAREIPFLTSVFRERGAERVLDVACGTGRHAVRLARAGYQVTGIDISTESLAAARAHAREQAAASASAGQAGAVSFLEGSFLELSAVAPGPFDALYCVGNSLGFCRDEGEVGRALGEFRAVLRPGGVAVVQTLNYRGIAERGERLDFVRSFPGEDGEHVVVKFFRFGEPCWDVEFVTLEKHGENWEAAVESGSLLALAAESFRRLWGEAGFTDVQFFGDYARTPFDAKVSRDCIAVALAPG